MVASSPALSTPSRRLCPTASEEVTRYTYDQSSNLSKPKPTSRDSYHPLRTKSKPLSPKRRKRRQAREEPPGSRQESPIEQYGNFDEQQQREPPIEQRRQNKSDPPTKRITPNFPSSSPSADVVWSAPLPPPPELSLPPLSMRKQQRGESQKHRATTTNDIDPRGRLIAAAAAENRQTFAKATANLRVRDTRETAQRKTTDEDSTVRAAVMAMRAAVTETLDGVEMKHTGTPLLLEVPKLTSKQTPTNSSLQHFSASSPCLPIRRFSAKDQKARTKKDEVFIQQTNRYTNKMDTLTDSDCVGVSKNSKRTVSPAPNNCLELSVNQASSSASNWWKDLLQAAESKRGDLSTAPRGQKSAGSKEDLRMHFEQLHRPLGEVLSEKNAVQYNNNQSDQRNEEDKQQEHRHQHELLMARAVMAKNHQQPFQHHYQHDTGGENSKNENKEKAEKDEFDVDRTHTRTALPPKIQVKIPATEPISPTTKTGSFFQTTSMSCLSPITTDDIYDYQAASHQNTIDLTNAPELDMESYGSSRQDNFFKSPSLTFYSDHDHEGKTYSSKEESSSYGYDSSSVGSGGSREKRFLMKANKTHHQHHEQNHNDIHNKNDNKNVQFENLQKDETGQINKNIEHHLHRSHCQHHSNNYGNYSKADKLEHELKETVQKHLREKQQWMKTVDHAEKVTSEVKKISIQQQEQLEKLIQQVNDGHDKHAYQWKKKLASLEQVLASHQEQSAAERATWEFQKSEFEKQIILNKEEKIKQQNEDKKIIAELKAERDTFREDNLKLQVLKTNHELTVGDLRHEMKSSQYNVEKRYHDSVEKYNESVSRLRKAEQQHLDDRGTWKLRLESSLSESRRLAEENEQLKQNITATQTHLKGLLDQATEDCLLTENQWKNKFEAFKSEVAELAAHNYQTAKGRFEKLLHAERCKHNEEIHELEVMAAVDLEHVKTKAKADLEQFVADHERQLQEFQELLKATKQELQTCKQKAAEKVDKLKSVHAEEEKAKIKAARQEAQQKLDDVVQRNKILEEEWAKRLEDAKLAHDQDMRKIELDYAAQLEKWNNSKEELERSQQETTAKFNEFREELIMKESVKIDSVRQEAQRKLEEVIECNNKKEEEWANHLRDTKLSAVRNLEELEKGQVEQVKKWNDQWKAASEEAQKVEDLKHKHDSERQEWAQESEKLLEEVSVSRQRLVEKEEEIDQLKLMLTEEEAKTNRVDQKARRKLDEMIDEMMKRNQIQEEKWVERFAVAEQLAVRDLEQMEMDHAAQVKEWVAARRELETKQQETAEKLDKFKEEFLIAEAAKIDEVRQEAQRQLKDMTQRHNSKETEWANRLRDARLSAARDLEELGKDQAAQVRKWNDQWKAASKEAEKAEDLKREHDSQIAFERGNLKTTKEEVARLERQCEVERIKLRRSENEIVTLNDKNDALTEEILQLRAANAQLSDTQKQIKNKIQSGLALYDDSVDSEAEEEEDASTLDLTPNASLSSPPRSSEVNDDEDDEDEEDENTNARRNNNNNMADHNSNSLESSTIEGAFALAEGLADLVHRRKKGDEHKEESSLMGMLTSLSDLMERFDSQRGQQDQSTQDELYCKPSSDNPSDESFYECREGDFNK